MVASFNLNRLRPFRPRKFICYGNDNGFDGHRVEAHVSWLVCVASVEVTFKIDEGSQTNLICCNRLGEQFSIEMCPVRFAE